MRRRFVFPLAVLSVSGACAGVGCVEDATNPAPPEADSGIFVPPIDGSHPGIDASGRDANGGDTSAPDAASPDTSVADTSVTDTSVADTSVADTSIADTSVADTNAPDTNVPDTNVPDTNVPDTNVPDTNVPDTSVPDAGPVYTHFVYVTGNNSVEGYGVDLGTGALVTVNETPDAGASFTLPTGSNPLASAIEGSTLYTVNTGGASVSAFTVTKGLLSRIDANPLTPQNDDYAAGAGARFIVTTSKFVFTANESGESVSRFTIGAGGTLSPLADVALPKGSQPKGIAVNPMGTLLFAFNYGIGTISAFVIDGAGGLAIVDQNPLVAGQQDLTVPTNAFTGVVHPTLNALYVTCGAGKNQTQAYSFDAAGVLTPLGSPVTVGSGGNTNPLPFGLAVDPKGAHLYMVSYEDTAINVYPLDSLTGAPSDTDAGAIASTGFANSRAISVDPGGAFAYVSGDNGFITSFSVNAATGGLTQIKNASSPVGGYTVPVTISP